MVDPAQWLETQKNKK